MLFAALMQNTHERMDCMICAKNITMQFKNISKEQLNISEEELTERFVRGDESRTTEGSGLGLSIAKNLIEAQGGEFEIMVDGL